MPWVIDDLPFSDKPTMIIGLNVYFKPATKIKVFSIVATMNNTFSNYWSNSCYEANHFDIAEFLRLNIPIAY